jgi:zinc/manganese transport system permease protein
MFSIFQYQFIQNAFMAGTCVAIVAAIMGYFVILRGLTFAGHALPNIGFAGAAGAVLLGFDPVIGLLAFTIIAAIAIGVLGKALRERDIAVGIIMTFALGLGILFLSLYSGYAERVYSILFGQIVGISLEKVLFTTLSSFLTLVLLVILFRPLLFSSFDPEVAEARGVPVNLLGLVFLVLVAITVSIAVQIVGALLFFTLLIGPAATTIRIVQRPIWAILLAIILGICYTWLGIFFAANGTWPVSFYIAMISFGVYLPIRLLSPLWIEQRARKSMPSRQDTFLPHMQSLEQEQNNSTEATGRISGLTRSREE